jgi:phosphoglycolate phosphatase-like HAD superfamily hydrolase
VGDSPVDAEAAMRARVLFVAVLSGMTPGEAFEKYPRYATINSLTELPDIAECHIYP